MHQQLWKSSWIGDALFIEAQARNGQNGAQAGCKNSAQQQKRGYDTCRNPLKSGGEGEI
jgi:hypothetical protein